MEKYVVSRELAEKLKGAGYPQESEWGWYLYSNGVWDLTRGTNKGCDYMAPMTDELLGRLPETFDSERLFKWRLEIKPIGAGWVASYGNSMWVRDHKSALKREGLSDDQISELEYWLPPLYAAKPSDLLAKLWLVLKEHGHVQ
jgi:hypothetical protein